eukprot:jgi/Tetstr1/432805/TSEL_022157.t1
MFAHSADSDAESDDMGVLDPVTIAQIVAEEEETANDLSRRLCSILLLGAPDLQWGDPDDDFDPMDYFVVPEDGGGRRQGGRRGTARGPLEGSLAWDEFRFKFRVPWPMFNWLLQRTRASKHFPDETLKKDGNPPAPWWRVLKVPSNVSTKEQLDDMFRSCSTLHNMLSQYDGLNTIGERDDDWEPLELDAIGGTASAAVEMINEQMRMDAKPEDLPTDLVDSDVGPWHDTL